ncbi:hypothetical protein M378DRAFT_163225 [Amanita muscaria Koide BX008]|uniref:Uncharacterized protein n=1 Tax=Amanita muscaria (strain Koide BX008) TaxID=946122 RepID=A0A0C2TCB1_AMAMK|nr:hypothetical protein M378DRAFT_163225 [Amanita muscaria Koide BX008]
MAPLPKNIWVAAGDGDLARVQELVENHSFSPNDPDPNTYTPMHAATSYGQLHVLDYLISQGGNVNIADNDGDTPLYTAENVETARYLVEHGAIIDRHNNDGISPIEHLQEEYPDVAAYIQSLTSPATQPSSQHQSQNQQPSQHQQELVSEQLTSQLVASVQHIVDRAQAEGRDPEEGELRQAISRAVLEGVAVGYDMTSEGQADTAEDGSTHKRQKLDNNHVQ